jgi:hypothetical protein
MKAAEEHYRAATAFFGCIDGSEDENVHWFGNRIVSSMLIWL